MDGDHAETAGMSQAEKLDYVLDRLAILDCINRYTRGVDRHDTEIIRSVYHPDGIDQHGAVAQGMDSFPDWCNITHEELTRAHTHNITTHNCEIDGSTAHAESYVLFGIARPDEKTTMLGGGRYIDRLEKRDGSWRIALRRLVIDWTLTGDGSQIYTDAYRAMGYPMGAWDRSDISYLRPLTLG